MHYLVSIPRHISLFIYTGDILQLFGVYYAFSGFPGGAVVKNPPASAGLTEEASSIPRSGRSPEGGNGNPLQYSCLENPQSSEMVSNHGKAVSGE